MQIKDSIYMDMALEIGFSKIGRTSPNPSVGAVIVKDGEVISKGGTSSFGKDHAEIVAIKGSDPGLLEGAHIYISLEPCCIHSKTPPCTDAIIDAGIKKVVIPILDPNPAVCGKGVDALKKSGIDVAIMQDRARMAYDLIRPFEKYIKKKRPYLIHKSAISIDGKIATERGDSKWISNEYSRFIAHRLRGMVDAVIVGKNTLVNDDPSLNVRLSSFNDKVKGFFDKENLNGSGRKITGYKSFFLEMLLSSSRDFEDISPLRVVIGLPDDYNPKMKIFHDDNYLIFVNENKKKKIQGSNWKELLDDKKIVLVKGKTREDETRQILDELYNMGKMLVLVEGGGTIAGAFFDSGESDQFLYFIAPKIIGKGICVIEGVDRDLVSDSLPLYDVSSATLHGDLIYHGYKEAAKI